MSSVARGENTRICCGSAGVIFLSNISETSDHCDYFHYFSVAVKNVLFSGMTSGCEV